MKQFFLLLCCALLVGCGGGGDGGGDSTPAATGTKPVINRVGMVVNTSTGYIQVDRFQVGDYANFVVDVTDPDLDISELELSQFYPSNATTPIYGPDIVPLGTQTDANVYISLFDDEYITGPKGNWRGEFIVRDKAGNESTPFVIYTVVE